jgi:hypothetical protein
LLEKIVGEGQSAGEQFTAPSGAVLGKLWGSGENLVRLGEQIFERCEFFSLWRGFTIRRALAVMQEFSVFLRRAFQTLPKPPTNGEQ